MQVFLRCRKRQNQKVAEMRDYEFWKQGNLPISYNMALEEYMLERSEKLGTSTIRFWNVNNDAVVLGYAESTNSIKEKDQSFDVARRITGGSHVQFDTNCLAYSFTVPRDGTFAHFDEMRKYYAELIGDALASLGINVTKVDNRASTINVNDKVVASHAMFWGVKSALMHGLMIINRYDADKILKRVVLNERKIGKNTYSEYAALKSIPHLSQFLESETSTISKNNKSEFVKKIISESVLRQVTNGKYSEKQLSENVAAVALNKFGNKHSGEEWFAERKPSITSDEAEAIPGEELDGKLKSGLGYCMYSQVSDKDFEKMSEPVE